MTKYFYLIFETNWTRTGTYKPRFFIVTQKLIHFAPHMDEKTWWILLFFLPNKKNYNGTKHFSFFLYFSNLFALACLFFLHKVPTWNSLATKKAARFENRTRPLKDDGCSCVQESVEKSSRLEYLSVRQRASAIAFSEFTEQTIALGIVIYVRRVYLTC